MKWWIYKCNSKNENYQSVIGNWDWLFKDNPPKHWESSCLAKLNEDDSARRWGRSEWIQDLAKLNKGDMVIAYQTDRNELVGIAKVRQSCEKDTFLYLKPIETIGVKVCPLKKIDKKVNDIQALKGGHIKTIYDISESDAKRLIEVAKAQL